MRFQFSSCLASSREQSQPGACQLDTLLVFFIKFGTEVMLKRFETLANRRRTHVPLSGCLSKILVPGNGDEKLNPIEQHERRILLLFHLARNCRGGRT